MSGVVSALSPCMSVDLPRQQAGLTRRMRHFQGSAEVPADTAKYTYDYWFPGTQAL
jgi:hypothetical protein